MTSDSLTPTTSWTSIIIVWAGAVAGAVLIGIFSPPGDRFAWIALTLAACTFGTLCIQLATRQKEGFVDRMSASVVGALVVLAVATGILALT